MGTISTTALAAHQIALQIAAVLFMVPFGISIAATVRVGHAVGRRDAAATRRAGLAALALGAAFMIVMTGLVALARDVLPVLFLGSQTPETAATFALTATLLLVGMFFFIADGLQTVAAGALRGFNDTRMPLVFATISFWVIGFTACWWLGFRADLGAIGVWIGLTIGILVYAVLLVTRFHMPTARGYMPEAGHTVSAASH
jgi:MATE family multidrug resistance protein